MQAIQFEVTTDDGLPLFVRGWLPAAETPKAIIQIAHGMAEHSARYQWLATQFTQAGFAVYANDHRGHGETAVAQKMPHGFFADSQGWQKVVDDLAAVNRHIQAQHVGVPVLLLAHSMGSHIGQSYLIRYGDTVSAAMLSGTRGSTGPIRYLGQLLALVESWRVGARGQSGLLDSMSYDAFNKSFRPARTRFDWLSRDQSQVDKYIADPWCGFSCSPRMWRDLLGGLGFNDQRRQQNKINKHLPIALITGARDTSNDAEAGVRKLEKRYLAVGIKRVDVRVYADGRHEMFNEINREEVASDTIAWFNSCL
jgi:alpha-beta hydrolase superfamily lysophospholipase